MTNKVVKSVSRASVEWEYVNALAIGDTKNINVSGKTVTGNVTDTGNVAYVDQLYSAQLTLTNNTSVTLNLTDGSLKDFFGVAFAITKLKTIHVDVISGGSTALGFTMQPYGSTNLGDVLPYIWDVNQTGASPTKKPVQVGGQYHEDIPGGYSLSTDSGNWKGFTFQNVTGGTVLFNVTFVGQA